MSALGVAVLVLAALVNERQQALRAVEAARDELEEKVRERTRQLDELARHDPLTALANVRSFTEELERAVRQAARGHHSALFFADLDRFKACNDTFGHAFGDSVLTAADQAMYEAKVRGNTIVAAAAELPWRCESPPGRRAAE